MSYEQLGQHVRDLGERAYRKGERALDSLVVSVGLTRRARLVLAERCFQDLPALFAPYARLPEPDGFLPVIRQLDRAMRALYAPHPFDLPPPAAATIEPNPSLQVLAGAARELSGWTGRAAHAFRGEVVEPFPSVVRNQCLSVVLAKAVVEAVRALWTEARIVIDQLAEHAIRAVDTVDADCRRHEWDVHFTGFEAVHATLRALVPRMGFPVGSAAAVLPAGLPTGRPVLRIGGTTVSGILGTVEQAVNDCTRYLNESEQALSWWLRDIRDTVAGAEFVLARPALASATPATVRSADYLGSAA
jgi:hypothetical protein